MLAKSGTTAPSEITARPNAGTVAGVLLDRQVHADLAPAVGLSERQPAQVEIAQRTDASPAALAFRQLGADQNNDLPLRRVIANFQRSSCIQSDGVIGLQTRVMLSRMAGSGPVLQAAE